MIIQQGYWKDWEVCIKEVGGHRLPEHGATHRHPPNANSSSEVYLECKHDQVFSINVYRSKHAPFDCLINSYVDGRKLCGSVFDGAKRHTVGAKSYELMNGVLYERSLVFNTLIRTEGSTSKVDELGNHLGTIVVELTAGTMQPSRFGWGLPLATRLARTSVDEKVKKGTVDTVVGGRTIARAEPERLWEFEEFPDTPQHTVTFHVRHLRVDGNVDVYYRTRDLLRAQGVLSTPVNVTSAVATEGATQRSRNPKAKREPHSPGSPPGVSGSSKDGARPRKRAKVADIDHVSDGEGYY